MPPGRGGDLGRAAAYGDARVHRRCRGQHLGVVDGDDAQRQHKGGHSGAQQHRAVELVQTVTRQQQAVEHVEHRDECRDPDVVIQEVHSHLPGLLSLLYLLNELAQLLDGNLLLLDEGTDGRQIGIVEIVLYHARERALSVSLLGDGGFVAEAVADGLVTDVAVALEHAHLRGDGVEMWFGIRIQLQHVPDKHRAMLPQHIHDFLFLCR